MRRFILDTGTARLYLDRKRGVFERAAAEVAKGNRVGIAGRYSPNSHSSPKAAAAGPEHPAAPLVAGRVETLVVDTAAAFEYGSGSRSN